jgi:ABC-2 family transporter protein
MIWLTWRQHRKQALFAVIGLAVLAAVLIPTGLQMYDRMADTGLRDCVRTIGQAELVDPRVALLCQDADSAFSRGYESRQLLALLLVFLPLLAGMFWGATLIARELEHGTHRLVWTQGVTRLRWLLVKVGLVAAGVTVVAAAYTVLMWWWITPLTGRDGRITFPYVDIAGLAPIGYVLFAVALGVLAGAVSRKVLPAMAITLVGFIAARIALMLGARPHFQDPLELRNPVAGELVRNRYRGDWTLSTRVYDADGNVIPGAYNLENACEAPPVNGDPGAPDGPATPGGPGPDTPGFAEGGPPDPSCTGYNLWTYQPGERYWLFQVLETAILVGLSGLLILLAAYVIRRRTS